MSRVERMIAKGRIIWNREGQKCRARGCKSIMRSSVHRSKVIYSSGPQGGWICESGHQGWIWPGDCELTKERQT